MKNIIIGKNSNLSNVLAQRLKDNIVISTRDLLSSDNLLEKYKDVKVNIIVNSFQPSIALYNLEFPDEYVKNSILATSMILAQSKKLNVNKIIYTSSSSVYGDNIYCREEDNLSPINIHAAFKIANEKMIEKFCNENNLNYTITRVFNMFGGNDNFSIISKITRCYFNKERLSIINNGNAIRDFISVYDVAEVYSKLLENNTYKIVNIGTGKGTSLRAILEYLEAENIKILTENIFRSEIKISTASVEKLTHIVNINELKDVKSYIKEKIKDTDNI